MDAIKPMCELQTELSKELGKDVKREYDHEVNDEALREQMNKELYQPAYDVTKQALEKQERAEAFEKILADFKEKYFEAHPEITADSAPYQKPEKSEFDIDRIGVKASQFSFARLQNADPVLGVDMSSTATYPFLFKSTLIILPPCSFSHFFFIPSKSIIS